MGLFAWKAFNNVEILEVGEIEFRALGPGKFAPLGKSRWGRIIYRSTRKALWG